MSGHCRMVVVVTSLAMALACSACSSKRTGTEGLGLPRAAAGALEPPPSASSTVKNPRSYADVAGRVLSGVVNISSTRRVRSTEPQSPFPEDPFFHRFFGEPAPRERLEQSLGSGVIVSKDGLVLTNNHVVASGADIRVVLSNREEYGAKVVGTDPPTDLALLRLQGAPKNLHTLALGDSDRTRVGDVVLAVGNPFAVGETVTMGIISAKGRANMGIVDYEDFIQTDAAINPGNSGGALVNMDGEAIGVNTAILSRTGGSQGIGFAIPSNMARPVMAALLSHGKVVRGWLGIAIQDLTPRLARPLGLDVTTGALVSDVLANSPAEKAGLRRGDVILKAAGQPVADATQLRNLIAEYRPGSQVALEVLRDRSHLTIQVKLGEQPSATVAGKRVQENRGVLAGLTLQELDQATRSQYNIPRQIKRGVVVINVDPGSPAAASGLQPGDIILEINRTPASSVQKFQESYKASSGQAALLVFRDGRTLYLVLSQ